MIFGCSGRNTGTPGRMMDVQSSKNLPIKYQRTRQQKRQGRSENPFFGHADLRRVLENR
jgi:hypothetical protein